MPSLKLSQTFLYSFTTVYLFLSRWKSHNSLLNAEVLINTEIESDKHKGYVAIMVLSYMNMYLNVLHVKKNRKQKRRP